MPIEIRELVIRTEIVAHKHMQATHNEHLDLDRIKKEILGKCLKAIKNTTKKNLTNR